MNNFSQIMSRDRALSFLRGYFWKELDRTTICFLVFLTPLFFLPWTINYLDLNKQALFSILLFIAFLFAVLKYLSSGELKINKSFVNIPVLFLFAAYGLSTIFSLSKYNSFSGWSSGVANSLLTLLLFVVLYFLIIHILKGERELSLLLLLLVISGSLAAALNIFQVFCKSHQVICITVN